MIQSYVKQPCGLQSDDVSVFPLAGEEHLLGADRRRIRDGHWTDEGRGQGVGIGHQPVAGAELADRQCGEGSHAVLGGDAEGAA